MVLFQQGAAAWDADLLKNRWVGGGQGSWDRQGLSPFPPTSWPTLPEAKRVSVLSHCRPFLLYCSLNSLETRVLMGEQLGVRGHGAPDAATDTEAQ